MKSYEKIFAKIEFGKHQVVTLIFLIAWVAGTYMLPNKYILREPAPVALTPVDNFIALSYYWIWAYVSYYIYIFGSFLVIQKELNKKIMVLAYFSAGLASTLIFFLFPTMISRDHYPLAQITDISAWVLQTIRSTDASVNCMPSMHVALSLIATLTICLDSKKLRPIAIPWFLLIAYSTMATKQHYFYDVVTGCIHGLFFWLVSYRYIQHQNQSQNKT